MAATSFRPEASDIIHARFFAPFTDGSELMCRTARFTCESDDTNHLPHEYITAQYAGEAGSVMLVETPSAVALVQHTIGVGGTLTVRARTSEESVAAIDEALAWFPHVDEVDDSHVDVDFWQRSQSMYVTTRAIEAPSWSEVAQNYPGEVRAQLDALMATKLDDPQGRIMLWHGPPGTGKTTAIRTIARAWQDQAKVQVVLDPESVFTNAAALMQVLLDARGPTTDGWRLLVIEDADELVRVGNDRMGRSLSRLLNVGDGIVGQGLKVLILLTTNEPPDRLHPALSRPGRCLSEIWFRRFQRAEAEAAFRHLDHIPDGEELSLAEIVNGVPSADAEATTTSGTYL